MRPVIEALNTDPAGPAEVVLVDNSAGREGRDLAQSLGVKLVSRSGGFSDGCNDGIAASTQPVVALLGHDTVPRPGWLPPLIQGLELPDVGAVIPTIEDGGRPGTFNTSGGYLTYVGLAWVSEHGRPIPENDEVSVVDFPCGGAMALRRETWDRFGGFRGQYFLYQEDSDLGWRLRLAGLSTVRIPDSRVVHEYEFGRQPNKMFLLERNRVLTVLANYRTHTLVLLAPVLVLTELGVMLVALRDGWLRQKFEAWRDVWALRPFIREWREGVEANRVIGDGAMLRRMRHRISDMPEISSPAGSVIVDRVLGAYKLLIAPVVSVFDRV